MTSMQEYGTSPVPVDLPLVYILVSMLILYSPHYDHYWCQYNYILLSFEIVVVHTRLFWCTLLPCKVWNVSVADSSFQHLDNRHHSQLPTSITIPQILLDFSSSVNCDNTKLRRPKGND